jgi:hypothetical protein
MPGKVLVVHWFHFRKCRWLHGTNGIEEPLSLQHAYPWRWRGRVLCLLVLAGRTGNHDLTKHYITQHQLTHSFYCKACWHYSLSPLMIHFLRMWCPAFFKEWRVYFSHVIHMSGVSPDPRGLDESETFTAPHPGWGAAAASCCWALQPHLVACGLHYTCTLLHSALPGEFVQWKWPFKIRTERLNTAVY